ncbi:methyl-accepting chemotaxis protein [uncultured Thiodictyon sp.]|uniref:methyl-accepting chemotaxis protein n=1 Tax=uncultured Thiodictyon sp. TaxID=1846217 RepID=UPI0025E03F36|nr:methyl-accepting chemotaxis protein [uncultured Thiodictyon sp.]
MTLSDISISARLTIATTALVLLVFVLIAGSVLLSVNGLYQERTQVGAAAHPAPNSELAALIKQGPPEFQAAADRYLTAQLDDIHAVKANQRQVAMALLVAVLLLGALLTGLVFYITLVRLATRFILRPAERVRDGLNRIRAALTGMELRRDFSERLDPGEEDELGQTVMAFNKALDFLERQNDQLNDSIIEMLQISSEISQARDLTLKLPVKEDITGPLGDALNRVTSESARVLVQVREIAERVGQASAEVQSQGRQVVAVADAERTQIEQTANELAQTVEAIDHMGELAQFCSDAANKATQSNDEALAAVKGAVQGMGSIRTSIQETGKRIKRLGERSQEISGIVDIINSFSERTHVLAINASMQAATAGEAGRGFAVVAQEVQRLADSSRQATNQIATLIRNIQVETQDTMQTVNQATEAVGNESRVIEGAGDRMLATQQTTVNLAEAVRQIDASAQTQVAANRTLMTRVDAMRASTVETTDQIDQQAQETNSLVGYSRQLLDSIGLFRLPPPARTNEPGRA